MSNYQSFYTIAHALIECELKNMGESSVDTLFASLIHELAKRDRAERRGLIFHEQALEVSFDRLHAAIYPALFHVFLSYDSDAKTCSYGFESFLVGYLLWMYGRSTSVVIGLFNAHLAREAAEYFGDRVCGV